jgi:hypothetical protein
MKTPRDRDKSAPRSQWIDEKPEAKPAWQRIPELIQGGYHALLSRVKPEQKK